MTRRRDFLAALAAPVLLGAGWPRDAHAADYPSSPVRFINPYAAGSDDVQARIVAKALSRYLKQPVVVEAHPGAGGNIAAHYVANSAPDGYTMLLGISAIFEANPLLYREPGFSPDGFRHVSLLSEQQFVLVVNPSVPARSVPELIEYARAHPGKLTNATAGIGSNLYLAALEFTSKAHVNIENVPYKGGAEDTVAVLSGFADMEFGGVPNVLPHLGTGKLRALGVTGRQRVAVLPDVPTIAQAGLPGYEFAVWNCISVPKATPAAVVATLHDAVVKSIAEDDVRHSLEQLGFTPLSSSPGEIERRIQAEAPMWRELFKMAGIKPQ
ncbi:Bug family tripartite tricarboxylate transporter substrate binding protein [Paraburkholderia sp.]|uniref:Bug family tripartite tricarboxylate transporter substrate binding protein n=1 Tax=Paraburkholderia sp. TaxID=1926495 RepID=UPI0039E43B86